MKPSVISVDPEIMSGAPCFAGARVPVHTQMKQRGATTEAQIEDLADANPIFEEIRNKFRGLSNAELILLVVDGSKT